MKNKVLVAMGIGVAAAMVPAVASVADVIDPENLTQEQLDAQAVIQEAEATEEQEEVNFKNDDDLLDSIEINLVPGAAPVQEGSVQAGEDGLTTPVHYADVTLNDNVEEEFHEFNTPAPTQMPLDPIVFIDPTATPTATATIVPVRPTVGEAGSADFGMGLVPAVNPVDMNASGKADQMADDLTKAGYLDVQVTKEEEKRVPLSQGLGNGNDPEPQLTKDQLVNTLITMKNVWGGFEDLIPYSDDALKAMTDEELVALNEQFKNIKIVQAVDDPEIKDTDEKVVLTGSFTKKEDRDSALINLKELGYACLKDLTDDDIAALSDEDLIAMGIQATTTTTEAEISLEAQTGLTKAQLAEKLAALAGNAEKEDDQGYDVLTPDNIRKALKEKGLLKDEDPVPAFEDMTDEQLLALSSKLGITRTTDPIDPDKTQDISGATRNALFEELANLKQENYEGLKNVDLDELKELSDDQLITALNAIKGLSDASKEVKNFVENAEIKALVDWYNVNYGSTDYDYIAVTLVGADNKPYTKYLKVSKVNIGDTIKDADGNEYTVTSKELSKTTLEDVDVTNFKVGNIYTDDDGNQYVITQIIETQAAVEGKVINKEAFEALSEEAQAAYSYNGKSLWISKVHFEDKYGNKVSEETYKNDTQKYHVVLTPIVSKDISITTKITLNDIDDYNVITLSADGYSTSKNNNQKNVSVYAGTDSDTNTYFEVYYEMLLDAAGKMKSELLDNNNNLKTGKNVANSICESIKDGTKFVKVSEGPNWNYASNFNPDGYDVPVYYVTSDSGVAKIYGNEKNNGNNVNPLKAVYVMAENIKEVLVKGINGVIVAPNAKIICDSTKSGKTITGTLIGKEVVNSNNITLKKGLIDIVGQEVDTYKSQNQEASYKVEMVSYKVNANRTLFDVTIADQTSVFSLEPETQAAKYLYGYTAPEQEATYKYGVEGEGVFYKYTVTGYKPTTISYYGEAVVTAPPVTPPPTDDDIITDTFVFTDAPADDAVAAPAPVAAVLGANRPVEVEGTVLGAIRSGSVLGERRAPGAVLGKRRSPKTADAAMGGMIAGMMLSMMTAFGGATVLKKKREDGE